QPLQLTGTPFLDVIHGALKVAWWFWTAWFLVGFLRAFIIVEHRPREGKLLQDLFAGLIYLAALFAVIAYVFDLPIQGLLATSGAVACAAQRQDSPLGRHRDPGACDPEQSADRGNTRPERHRKVDQRHLHGIRNNLLRRRAGLGDACAEPIVRSDFPPPRCNRD